MHMKLSCLMIALAFAGAAQAGTPRQNEAATARHLAALTAGAKPQLSALTLFFSRMPKGGDLHHHYSGSVYAEHYLPWIDQQGWCVDKQSYRITTDQAVAASQRALAPPARTCLSSAEVLADDFTYRELLQRWSSKDFDNHGAIQPPPDRQFFQTFGYFGPVSNVNFNTGLLQLKARAVAENVGYIETMFKMAPPFKNDALDAAFATTAGNDAALTAQLRAAVAALERDPAFGAGLADYVGKIEAAAAGVDDADFTMRYQVYVLRLLQPSQVFSSMLAGFKAASMNPLIVGVNIVGQESNHVSMRDYSLHMKMFQFLKAVYPDVKLALHAGELALGDVPPEGMAFHIDEALRLAGADRIGHGLDLAHESNALGIMKSMRERGVPVEVNLTSNAFISGIRDENHPVTLYRKYGVPMVISTDDAGVTRHNLSREYVLFASRYKPAYAEIKKISYNSLRYAFLDEANRKRLIRQLDARYAKFEAEMAALRPVRQ
ncbi:adenosine deaminase [Massilia glaciei]|uniref:adenosine deaminase n=1 Tax=Massilia glaciei TaxID=1524097 RepID=A0A2U2HBZ9_9BURK|nr:adenosine deaminase [Massilia glaciei]PWF40345.1 adenosine deaminase [Massilia glaciei]